MRERTESQASADYKQITILIRLMEIRNDTGSLKKFESTFRGQIDVDET